MSPPKTRIKCPTNETEPKIEIDNKMWYRTIDPNFQLDLFEIILQQIFA